VCTPQQLLQKGGWASQVHHDLSRLLSKGFVMHHILSNVSAIALIAEADDLTRAVLKHALEGQGYQVFEASNGQECLQQCEQLLPDIILLDSIMPVMDGYACCEALRKRINTVHTPIVMLSHQDDNTSIQQAFDLGATDYVLKPIQWKFFFQRMTQLMKQATLLRQLSDQNAEYQQAATVDDLTQLLNRRAFSQYLEREWKRAKREAKSLSIILAHVDLFKVDSDAHDPTSADQHLKDVAQVLSHAVYRSTDLVCRWGSEEFGILLPNTSLEGAINVVARIKIALKDSFRDCNSSIANKELTLSFGLSGLVPFQEIELTQLLAAAETALQNAKRKGSNHIAVHSVEKVESLMDSGWLKPLPKDSSD
jgi:diguanylate cyclase (GGDEF)-like protein